MSQYKIDAEVVLRAARGRWDEILACNAPALQEALKAAPNHVACPIHGGSDGFRFFKDYKVNGNCICNTCGAFDGLHILMAVNGWNFFTALKAVNDYLQIPEGVTVDENETYDGKVLELGMNELKSGTECFALKLRLENGYEKGCWGSDIKRACTEAGIKEGDNVRVMKVGTKTFMYKGKNCRKVLWAVRKLASDEEIAEREKKAQEERERRIASIAAKWDAARPVDPQDPAQKPLISYLTSRGIFPADISALENVRYSPAELYFDDTGMAVGRFPAMVCAVRDKDGKLITLHRTFLTKEGRKIAFGTPKKLMPVPAGQTVTGSFISLGTPDKTGIMCAAEGVETALSIVCATGYPCLSAVSAQGLMSLTLPESVRVLFVFADRDKSLTGQKAAEKLRARLAEEGVPCVVLLPPEDTLTLSEKGTDWNDVIRLRGPSVFPFRRGLSFACETDASASAKA